MVDPQTGCITSLYDKKAKFETLAPGACGNELQAFKDMPKDYDAWNIDPGTLDHSTSHRQCRFGGAGRERTAARRHSRDAHLAELEVRPGHHALCRRGPGGCGQRLRLARNACAAEGCFPAGRDQRQGDVRDSLRHDSSGRPRATTVGRRRSSKCPRCAGPTWAMGSTASA